MGDPGERIDELEQRLAFQDDLINKLDDAVASQQQQIMMLERQLKLLGEQVRKQEASMPESAQGTAADEKPPHY